jgi:hypothetical protein
MKIPGSACDLNTVPQAGVHNQYLRLLYGPIIQKLQTLYAQILF